jgi:GNAT superfamily N-acetyltransferase
MCDEWMARLDLPMTPEQFQRLPRQSAYRYDYFEGRAWINPKPRYYHALLDLSTASSGGESPHARVRPCQPDDWERLPEAFASGFRNMQPFGALDDNQRLDAARDCLKQTREGGDGPWIERASFVALSADGETILGAILVTLTPLADPTSWDGYRWTEPPPPDAVVRRLGRPHLTWIFVTPARTGEGVGTLLLHSATRALREGGFTELASTFLLGNDSSMLWHWRNGFRLLAYPGSRRRVD